MFYTAFLALPEVKWKLSDIKDKNKIILTTKSIILDHKIKQDYDEKYLYTPLNTLTKVGDVFLWERTNTHWLVYAEHLTEKAYYKTIIKRANWCICWKDNNDNMQYQWVYVRGPVETKTNSAVLKGKVFDMPNETLTIVMPNSQRNEVFKKYDTIMLNGKKWKVAADEDDISNVDLIELQMIKTEIAATDDVDSNIIDGLLIPDYNFKPLFNNKVDLNTTLNMNDNIILYRQGKIIPNDFSIVPISGNPVINGADITFPKLTDYVFKVIYNLNKNIEQTFTVTAVGFGAQEILNKIIGQTKVKTLFGYEYYTNVLKVGDRYTWEFEDGRKLVKNYAVTGNKIRVNFGLKTGTVKLKLYVNGALADTIVIKVGGTFE